MVLTDKTLDQMLKEIGYSNPIKDWDPYSFERKDQNKSYLIKFNDFPDKQDYNDTSNIFGKIIGELDSWFRIIPSEMAARTGCLSELISNAIEWGKGIKEINCYLSQNGAVVNIIQNSGWKYKEVIAKINEGQYPSSREETEDTTSHGGGCGLQSAKNDKYSISYNGLSTLLLMKRELVEENLQ